MDLKYKVMHSQEMDVDKKNHVHKSMFMNTMKKKKKKKKTLYREKGG